MPIFVSILPISLQKIARARNPRLAMIAYPIATSFAIFSEIEGPVFAHYPFFFTISFRGRRNQGGFSLNSPDYGVFAAFKYEVNMLLSSIGPEVFSWVSRSSKKSIFIWASQWLCKAI